MKRIILLLFLSCACYLNVTAACKEVHKIGGTTHEDGPDTYRHVGESNNGTRLDCNGQGNLDCKWKDGVSTPFLTQVCLRLKLVNDIQI